MNLAQVSRAVRSRTRACPRANRIALEREVLRHASLTLELDRYVLEARDRPLGAVDGEGPERAREVRLHAG